MSRKSREIQLQCGRSLRQFTSRRDQEPDSMPMKHCSASESQKRSLSVHSLPEQTKPCRISKHCAPLTSPSLIWTRNWRAWPSSVPFLLITTTLPLPYSSLMPSTWRRSNLLFRMRKPIALLATVILQLHLHSILLHHHPP